MIRVFVVHHAKLIANIIATVLGDEPDIFVSGTAVEPQEALDKLSRSNCDVVLVAANIPQDGALQLTRTIARSSPETEVLIIGVPHSQNVIMRYVAAGAGGYVLENVPVERLLENVRAAHDKKALISPDIAAALMDQVAYLVQVSTQNRLNPESVESLTPREREVLNLIGQSLTNQEIADRLTIEVGTVKNHVHNILSKLDAANREEAATYLPLLDEDSE